TTFFMGKNPLRIILTCFILSSILCSNIYFLIGGYHVLFSFVLLIIISGLLFANQSKSFYHLFCSFTLMIGYIAVLLWKQSTLIWLFVPEVFLVSLICCILVFLMIKGLYNRLLTSTLGIASGEILHGLILTSYDLPVTIGDLDFFVILYLIILYLLLLHIFQKGKNQFLAFISKLSMD